MHLKARPFECACGKTFGSVNNLCQHLKVGIVGCGKVWELGPSLDVR